MVQNFHDLFQSWREVQNSLMRTSIRTPSCVIKRLQSI